MEATGFLFLLFINRYLETQLLTVTSTTRLVDSFAMCTQQNFLLQPPMQHCQQLIDFVVQTADSHNVHRRVSSGYPLPTKKFKFEFKPRIQITYSNYVKNKKHITEDDGRFIS
jgi:hypothetical protein